MHDGFQKLFFWVVPHVQRLTGFLVGCYCNLLVESVFNRIVDHMKETSIIWYWKVPPALYPFIYIADCIYEICLIMKCETQFTAYDF